MTNNNDIEIQIALNPNYDYYKSVDAFVDPNSYLTALNYSNDIYYSYFFTSITWSQTQVFVTDPESRTGSRATVDTYWVSSVTYGESQRNDLISAEFWSQQNLSLVDSNIYFNLRKQQINQTIAPAKNSENQ